MNIKKTLESIVVWYNPTTGKVSLAKNLKTGKFVSLSVAQGLLNVELKAFNLPSVNAIMVNYSFAQTLVIVLLTLLVALLLGVFGLLVAYGLAIQAMVTFIGVGIFGMMLHAATEDHLKVSV